MSLDSLLQSIGVQKPAPQPAPMPLQQRPAYSQYQNYMSRPPTPTPPPGFTSSQWSQLLNLSKTNPSIADLVAKYTAAAGGGNGGSGWPGMPGKPGTPSTPQPTTPPADQWRREMPTDTSQLLRQLSFNAGEMGMPGGYVGAVQIPAYGSTQAPVNNPDMTTYGQDPGLGEATFYMQSMNGGMAPISAMSPLGVPAGWNPGGDSRYKNWMKAGAKGGMYGAPPGYYPQSKSFDQVVHDTSQSMGMMGSGVGPNPTALWDAAFGGTEPYYGPYYGPDLTKSGSGNKKSSSSNNSKKKGNKGSTSSNSNYQAPANGVPISLPFGF